MAKFLVAAVALVATIGFIEASPVLGGLTSLAGGAQGGTALTGGGGGLLRGGLVGGVVSQLQELVYSVTHTVAENAIRAEVEKAIQLASAAASERATAVVARGALRDVAVQETYAAVIAALTPSLERICVATSQAAVDRAYQAQIAGPGAARTAGILGK